MALIFMDLLSKCICEGLIVNDSFGYQEWEHSLTSDWKTEITLNNTIKHFGEELYFISTPIPN